MLKSIVVGLLLISFSSVTAVAQQGEEQIVGKWKADVEKTRKLLETEGSDDPERTLSMIESIGFEFSNDGSCVMFQGDQTQDGTYELKDTDEEGTHSLVLSQATDASNQFKAIVTFNDDGTMTIQPEFIDPVVFEKAGDEKSDTAMQVTDQQIVGKWQGNAEETRKINGDDEPEQMGQMVGGMFLDFRQDGTYSMIIKTDDVEQATEGTWELGEKNEDGKSYAFTAETDEGTLEFSIWMPGKNVLVFRQDEQEFATAFVRQKDDK